MENKIEEEVLIELITRAQNGDEEAFESILDGHRNLIHFIMRKYNFGALPYDDVDIELELKLELYHAVLAYDFRQGVAFSTYLYTRYVYFVSRLFRKYNAKKRYTGYQLTLETPLSGNWTLADVLNDEENCEEIYTKKMYVDSIYKKIKEILTKEEYEMYILYLEGTTLKQLSVKYDLSYDKIRNKMTYIRRKIQKKYK